MKNKVKKIPKKIILAFIICAITFSMVGATASTLLYSSDVTYDNSSSGLSSTNLQDALDELYEQAVSCPVCDSEGNCTVTCPSGTIYQAISTGYKCFIPTLSNSEPSKLVVTSGNGLYADSVTIGRYIYRGSSVNNYITFNSEIWRIISVESNGTLKIIRNEQLSSKQYWDEKGTRDSSTSTYCTHASSDGCNAWAATANLISTPSNFIQYSPNGNTSDNEKCSGTVTGDASLNTYLNGDYYNSLSSEAKSKVVKGTFNVSTPGNGSYAETLELDAQQEKLYQWKGYVALATITEYFRASTSSDCTSLKLAYSSTNTCDDNNWLWPTFNTTTVEWTLSPYVVAWTSRGVWHMTSSGNYTDNSARYPFGVRPVLHLSSDITLSGSGTSTDPYTIN